MSHTARRAIAPPPLRPPCAIELDLACGSSSYSILESQFNIDADPSYAGPIDEDPTLEELPLRDQNSIAFPLAAVA